MAPFWKLSVAGFAATAITYGPAKMGFGLLLSEFRADFALSTGMAGLVSHLGFIGIPTSWPGVVLSAGPQGAYVMMMSGILAFWPERLFPQMPARSFTAALIAVAGGERARTGKRGSDGRQRRRVRGVPRHRHAVFLHDTGDSSAFHPRAPFPRVTACISGP